MDGEAYLRRLIENALPDLGQRQRDQASGMSATMRLREIDAAGLALVAAGVLTEERRRQLSAELEELLVDRGLVKRVWLESSTEASAAASGIQGERRRADWTELLDAAPQPQIVRVVPVVEDAHIAYEEARLHILSLEIWTDHFLLRYVVQSGPGDLMGYRWDAWDDAGTPYRTTGGGGRGKDGWYEGSEDFAPAPPAEASTVTFTAREIPGDDEVTRFSVSLR